MYVMRRGGKYWGRVHSYFLGSNAENELKGLVAFPSVDFEIKTYLRVQCCVT